VETSSKKWFVVAAAAIVVVCGLGFTAKPAYRSFKVWRAHQIAQNVEQQMDNLAFMDAVGKILTAQKLVESDPYVLRVKGKLYNKIHHPKCQDIWVKLVEVEPSNYENWEGLFYAAMATRDPKMAFMATVGLRKAAPGKESLAQQLEFEFLLSARQTTKAVELGKKLLLDSGLSDRFQLLIYDFFLQTEGPEQQTAREWLKENGSRTDPFGLSCLITLAKARKLNPEECAWIRNKLSQHPNRTDESELLATVIGLKDEIDDAKIRSAWKAFADGKDLVNRAKYARWLDEQNNFVGAECLVSIEEALHNRDAALVAIDVLGNKQLWKDVKQLLDDPDIPLEEPIKLLYLARVAYETQENGDFLLRWKFALNAAKNNPESLGYLANYASLIGWSDQAIETCRLMTTIPKFSESGWLGLYNIALNSSDETLKNECLGHLDVMK